MLYMKFFSFHRKMTKLSLNKSILTRVPYIHIKEFIIAFKTNFIKNNHFNIEMINTLIFSKLLFRLSIMLLKPLEKEKGLS